MNSLAQLEFEMDTEKQRQHRCDDVRLTESGNARRMQLLVMPTESLTNREWMPGELLSGSECRKLSWFLDMKNIGLALFCFVFPIFRVNKEKGMAPSFLFQIEGLNDSGLPTSGSQPLYYVSLLTVVFAYCCSEKVPRGANLHSEAATNQCQNEGHPD